MSDVLIIAIVSVVGNITVALISKFGRNKINERIKEVHDSVNGKMEKLLQVTKDASHAEGVKDEKKDEQDRKEKNGL